MKAKTLDELRQSIDSINLEILKLLNERIEIVRLIGIEKEKIGKKIHDPHREQQIIEDLIKKNKGELPEDMLSHIFTEIFKISVQIQEEQCINSKSDAYNKEKF